MTAEHPVKESSAQAKKGMSLSRAILLTLKDGAFWLLRWTIGLSILGISIAIICAMPISIVIILAALIIAGSRK